MWLPATTTAEPASEPVTLAEARAQCRVDGTDSDTDLALYITAARQHVESVTGTRIVEQTVELKGRSFGDLASLPIAPVQSITSVKYLDASGVEQTLSTDVYEAVLTGFTPFIRLKFGQSWPSVYAVPDAVRVVAVVGYDAVPDAVRSVVLWLVGQWNDQRADAVDRAMYTMPNGVEALLTNYRIF